ncbi:hypothetical protein GGE16_000247 [Rhizobium leguminosarum]|uniref:Uncharacterized protein n=1 Tax=Rhizobium leguminosarum TaxID=384 RepID=A0AAE2MF76_RHILE|nr:hypothetical protein [Rhizobium leguminosarum]MBB4432191.1 hypothetical protein [Rhizobium esperanzae]MBB4295678.1 hypothetical protein [Rhizobium leguminosarum]MBB4307070.1 hypothetical protein [Rhizobium leguminosarum]MBB4417347.1 hypothetical protein [Rhizobium leguminosarum]
MMGEAEEIVKDFKAAANFGIPRCYIESGGELLTKALCHGQKLRLPSADLPGRNCPKQKAESLIEPVKRGNSVLERMHLGRHIFADEDDIHAEVLQCPGILRIGCLGGVLDAKWSIARLAGVFLPDDIAIEQHVAPPRREIGEDAFGRAEDRAFDEHQATGRQGVMSSQQGRARAFQTLRTSQKTQASK